MGKRGFSKTLAFGVIGYIGFGTAALAQCAETTLSMRGDFGAVRFDVTVADDAAERAQGLMHVEEMPQFTGMLFVFEGPRSVSFWMRNTLIPLDMIFVGADGVVDHIHPMAVPLDETPIPGGDAIQYVLEINGGLAERLGLSVGDQLQHPSISGDVAWPCEEN